MAISYRLVSKQRGGMFLGAKPTLKSLSPRAALPSASFSPAQSLALATMPHWFANCFCPSGFLIRC